MNLSSYKNSKTSINLAVHCSTSFLIKKAYPDGRFQYSYLVRLYLLRYCENNHRESLYIVKVYLVDIFSVTKTINSDMSISHYSLSNKIPSIYKFFVFKQNRH